MARNDFLEIIYVVVVIPRSTQHLKWQVSNYWRSPTMQRVCLVHTYTAFSQSAHLWSKNKNFHSRLCLDVNSLLLESTMDISLISWGVWRRPVPTKTILKDRQIWSGFQHKISFSYLLFASSAKLLLLETIGSTSAVSISEPGIQKFNYYQRRDYYSIANAT